MDHLQIMTWGELKIRLRDLPDDAHIVIDEDATWRFAEVRVDKILPAVDDLPPCVVLEMGQIWNEELDLENRVDEYIGFEPEGR